MNKKILVITILSIFFILDLTTSSATIFNSTPPTPTPGGNIAGVVYENGIAPPDQGGLEGIEIELTNQDGTITRTTVSLESGRFIFLDLPFDEEYTITAKDNDKYQSNSTVVVLTEENPAPHVFLPLDPKKSRLFNYLDFPFIKLLVQFPLFIRLLKIL